MTREQHIEAAITELTRAKITIADDPFFALARLTDARYHISAVTVELGVRAPRGHYPETQAREVA